MVYVRALGTAQIEAGNLRITPAAGRRFALLLRLAAEAGRRVSRPILLELVFPGLPESNARHSLRDLLYQFRQAGVMVDADAEGVALSADDVRSDHEELIRSPRPSVELLRAAQGGLLPGYAPEHSEMFAEWLAEYRARVVLGVCRTLSVAMDRTKSVGDWLTTEQIARACLGLEPSHEGATIALAETLAVSGSKAEGAKLLDNYIKELGSRRSQLHGPALAAMRRINERIPHASQTEFSLPFLGRDSEMLLLNERFEMARAGESQCVVLVGDAGVGKTRLAQEFCTQALLKGAHVEHVATQPHDAHRPMATFADLVPRLLRLPGSLGCAPESMAALERLTKGGSDELATATASERVAAAIARAIVDLVDAVAGERTLLVLVDDVQWTDDLSRLTMASLVASRHPRRIMLLLTSRDRSALQSFSQRSERLLGMALPPLNNSHVQEILSRLPAAADQELLTWIAECCGGNPLFLRYLLSHYKTTGERFVVPSSLSTLLDQRLAAVSAESFAVLSMCVVLGRHSNADRLVSGLELRQLQLQLALRELETAYLVHQSDQRIEPAHWLVAEAAARAMSPIARRLLHRRAATMLEADADADGVGGLVHWDCAEHWIAAGDRSRADRVMRACAAQSMRLGRPRQAAEVLLRAATIVEGESRAELVSSAMRLAHSASETDIIRQADDLARQLGVRIKYEGCELALALARVVDWDEDASVYDELKRWLSPDMAAADRIKAGTTLLFVAEESGNPERGHEVFRLVFPQDLDASEISDVDTLIFVLIYHASFGNSNTALEVANRLLEIANSLDPVTAAGVRRKCGTALIRAGKVDAAIATTELAYAGAAACGLWRLQFTIASMLAAVCVDLLRDDQAAYWLDKVHRLADEMPESRTSSTYIRLMSYLASSREDIDGIREWLGRLLEIWPQKPGWRTTRWLRVLRSQIHYLSSSPGEGDVGGLVRDLVAHHRPQSELGDLGDSEIAAAAELLLRRGDVASADRMIRQYLGAHRRKGTFLASGLRRTIERVAEAMSGSQAQARPAPVSLITLFS